MERTPQIDAEYQKCIDDQKEEIKLYEADKRAYEGIKYVVITLINLGVLVAVLFIPGLQKTIVTGLFTGSVFTTFAATIRYFETNE